MYLLFCDMVPRVYTVINVQCFLANMSSFNLCFVLGFV